MRAVSGKSRSPLPAFCGAPAGACEGAVAASPDLNGAAAPAEARGSRGCSVVTLGSASRGARRIVAGRERGHPPGPYRTCYEVGR